jgi:hypothetical protein
MSDKQQSLNNQIRISFDAESEFLTELLDGYKKWKAVNEKEYAEAYRVLLNQFTSIKSDE